MLGQLIGIHRVAVDAEETTHNPGAHIAANLPVSNLRMERSLQMLDLRHPLKHD